MGEIEVELKKWETCIREINPNGFAENCAECAVQTDSMLRGEHYNAARAGAITQLGSLERYYKADFEHYLTAQQIGAALERDGAGATAIIFGHTGDPEVGHYFNAINHRGVIRYLDGQSGGPADLSRFVDGELSMLRTQP